MLLELRPPLLLMLLRLWLRSLPPPQLLVLLVPSFQKCAQFEEPGVDAGRGPAELRRHDLDYCFLCGGCGAGLPSELFEMCDSLLLLIHVPTTPTLLSLNHWCVACSPPS